MELDFCGVYRLSKDGKLTLLTKEMTKPNGIAFSPDEKTLYVANSDPQKAVWMAFAVKADGTLGQGQVFYDATEFHKDLDEAQGPAGRHEGGQGRQPVRGRAGRHAGASPRGKLLGMIATGVATANCNWGDDGSTLYITPTRT